MIDINVVIESKDGRKLVMLTMPNNMNYFFFVYPDKTVKEVSNVKPMKKADKDIFIKKLFKIMND